jgi:hypothetical protein
MNANEQVEEDLAEQDLAEEDLSEDNWECEDLSAMNGRILKQT